MAMLKNLFKDFSTHHVIGLLALIFIVLALGMYSQNKTNSVSGMSNNQSQDDTVQADAAGTNVGQVSPANPSGENSGPASVSNMNTAQKGMPSNCSSQAVANPADLLPKDTNSEWARLNPAGSGDLQNVNLLKAGYHIGIDTIGQSLRNANLQLRSEPANPQLNVGPWNNTTIEPDLMRVPLELGCGPQ